MTARAVAMAIGHLIELAWHDHEDENHAHKIKPCLYCECWYGSVSLLAELACNLPECNHILCVSQAGQPHKTNNRSGLISIVLCIQLFQDSLNYLQRQQTCHTALQPVLYTICIQAQSYYGKMR